MAALFAETLRKLRAEKGFSQKSLAEQIYVDRSTIARWENGSRMPDAMMITRLSRCLDIDAGLLFRSAEACEVLPNVIIVDDIKIFLAGALPILEEAMPRAAITGFTSPAEAIEFAKINRVALAFLDIELGKVNGLELCRTLLNINPRTNVVYLTAYIDYSFDAWSTGASGFMLKPLTLEGIKSQLKNLRYPLQFRNSDA